MSHVLFIRHPQYWMYFVKKDILENSETLKKKFAVVSLCHENSTKLGQFGGDFAVLHPRTFSVKKR